MRKIDIKRFLPLFLALFLSTVAFGKVKPGVYNKVSSYPASYKNAGELAAKINSDFSSDLDKAAAIYTWIALNINYDVKSLMSGKPKSVSYSYRSPEEKEAKEREIQEGIVRETLRKRKAVCEGYAALYKKLCDLCRVECVTVKGVAKIGFNDIGVQPQGSNHAWNAIKIDGQWYLLDSTWGTGSVNFGSRQFNKVFEEGYFMTSPERFFAKHYPIDEQWLLIKRDAGDFARLPLYHEDYLFSNDQLLLPASGLISKVKKGKLSFKLQSSRGFKQMYFAFQGDREPTLLDVKRQGDLLSFDVPLEKRKSGYFTVYADGKGLFSFQYKP